ncbi:MAG: four helix bundle protein [Deltaproteobacteria bacterium]|jgi:hypothetical protein|nr:four helix bundle protein [Deltaproteobacteria bacterium]
MYENQARKAAPGTGGLLLQQKWEDLALYLHNNVLAHMGKRHLFTLGERLDALLWDVQADIVRLTYNSGNRLPQLLTLDAQKEILLAQLRLAVKMKIVPERRFDHISDLILEIGRIIGGLKKRNSAMLADRGTAR